jgi:hypothetical protein
MPTAAANHGLRETQSGDQMTENPYQPSLLPAWSAPPPEQPGISIGAILLGVFTDVGGTIVLTFVLSVVFTIYLLSEGVAPENLAAEMSRPTFYVIGLVPGLSLTFLGGYVAGRVARRKEVLHGAITGCISATASLLMHLWQAADRFAFLGAIVVLPIAILGARVALAGRRKREAAAKLIEASG